MDEIDEAIDFIDAAVFSGDTFFDDEKRENLKNTIISWLKELDSIERTKKEMEEENES